MIHQAGRYSHRSRNRRSDRGETFQEGLVAEVANLLRRFRRAFPANRRLTVLDRIRRFAGPAGAYTRGKRLIGAQRLNEACEMFNLAERLWREELDANHPYLANALAYRAWCEVNLGQFADGLRDYEEAVSIAKRVAGSEHPRTIQLLQHLEWARESLQNETAVSIGPPHVSNDRTD